MTFRGRGEWPDFFDRASDLLAAEDEARYRAAEPPAAYREARQRDGERDGEPT